MGRIKCNISVLLLVISMSGGTVISNLNVMFETFQPLSMVRFFEFNDVGWSISEKCIKDMFLYLDGLHKDVLWAVKLYDASGYYSGSIYAGNNIRRGNPQLCRELNRQLTVHDYQNVPAVAGDQTIYEDVQDYLNLSAFLPFRVQLVNVRYKATVERSPFRSYIIHQSVCMPKSCTHNDLMQVMSFANISHLRNNLIMRNTELIDLKILRETYDFRDDPTFFWFMWLTTVLVLLGVIGTTLERCTNFDVKINLMKIEHKNAFSTDTQFTNRLNNLKGSARNHKNSENTKNNLNFERSIQSSIQNVNLVQMKEIKAENISTINLDILTANIGAKSNYTLNSNGSMLFMRESMIYVVRRILLAFSWRRNYEILFSDLPKYCINDVIEVVGLRVLCLLWILVVHVCTVLYYVSDNKTYKNRFVTFNYLQGILNSGSLAIDTHFFLCGICVAHMFFNRMKHIGADTICSCFSTLLHISSMITYKIFSMTIPYVASMLILQMCMKHFNDFSIIDIPSVDHKTCSSNMWRNIFFIDQFYPLDQRCMIWSWILSLEMQCFVVACIILLILKNHPHFGIIIFCSFLIGSFIATTMLRFNDQQPTSNHNNSSLIFDEHLAFYNGLYDQPWSRLSPYFFGICMGYVLHKIDGKLEINIIIVTCGWVATSFLIAALFFSKAFFPLSTHWMNAMLSVITYTIWSIILLWIILASITKYRGFIGRLLTANCLLPFSKMTNCFLMVHPIITRLILLSSDGSFHMSFGLIMTMYFGFVIFSVLSSFMLYMVYQAPIEAMLRIVYNRKMKY